jgi:hypothetical protein
MDEPNSTSTSGDLLGRPTPHPGGGVHIGGSVSGQVAVGRDIGQTWVTDPAAAPTPPDLAGLRVLLDDLATRVATEAPPEHRDAALQRVDELGKALDPAKPKVYTLATVRDWFAEHLPKLAGAVTSLIVNPLVGQLVQAAGDVAVAQFKAIFGAETED